MFSYTIREGVQRDTSWIWLSLVFGYESSIKMSNVNRNLLLKLRSVWKSMLTTHWKI